MFKIVALLSAVACASAGYIGGYSAAPIGSYGYAAPIATVGHAPLAVAHAPVATSYANTYRTVNKAVAVAAPISYAAPITTVAHASLPIAAPAISYGGLYKSAYGLGHGYGLGYSSLLHH